MIVHIYATSLLIIRKIHMYQVKLTICLCRICVITNVSMKRVKTECKVECKVEDNDSQQGSEHRGRSHKATDYYYDVNWRHDTTGKKANSHKVPNKFSYYDLRPYRQEYVIYPATRVSPSTNITDQRSPRISYCGAWRVKAS